MNKPDTTERTFIRSKMRRHIAKYLIALGKMDVISAELHKGLIMTYSTQIVSKSPKIEFD